MRCTSPVRAAVQTAEMAVAGGYAPDAYWPRFEEDAAEADVALVYYSGHGVVAGGENFLVPVDAGPPAENGAASDLVAVGPILERLRKTVPIVIVLLDACRTNPFPPGTIIASGGAAAPASWSGDGSGWATTAASGSENSTTSSAWNWKKARNLRWSPCQYWRRAR